jgi:hypothetical protein
VPPAEPKRQPLRVATGHDGSWSPDVRCTPPAPHEKADELRDELRGDSGAASGAATGCNTAWGDA